MEADIQDFFVLSIRVANEMAMDGVDKEGMVERIKSACAEA